MSPLSLLATLATPSPAPAAAGASSPAPAVYSAQMTEWLIRQSLEWGGKILAVILLLIIAWLIGGWARRAIGRVLNRPRIDRTLGHFLGNLVRWIVLIIAIVACLGFFGFNLTSVAALVGAAGLTVGLALQGSLSNLAAGIMLLLLRPFKVGDVVLLSGQMGKVDDIDLFNTKIDTPDNRRLIVPNGQIFGNTIENITHHPFRRCEVLVGTAYGADLRRARAALRSAGESIPLRDQSRNVEVMLLNLGNNAIEWAVRVWVPTTEFGASRDRLAEAIKDALDADGISIPFPQTELWFRNALPAPPPESARAGRE